MTTTNEARLAPFNLKPAEEVTWTGAAGAKVAGWIVKPANFNARRKYPLVVLIHGGPQGAWNDNWGYRWNPQIFANAGYVAFMPNPRGSTGYGQQFVAEISGDWGGKVNPLAVGTEREFVYPGIDTLAERLCATGLAIIKHQAEAIALVTRCSLRTIGDEPAVSRKTRRAIVAMICRRDIFRSATAN